MTIDYREKVEEIVKQLSADRIIEADDAIKRLRKKGRTFQWLYTALNSKPVEAWNENGFGLLFSSDYQEDINSKIELEAAKTKALEKEAAKYLELYDKYYAQYKVSGPVTGISKHILSKEMARKYTELDRDKEVSFWGLYIKNRGTLEEEEGWYFGTHNEFWTYMGYNKEPEVVYWIPPIDKEWEKEWENRMTRKKKLFDIH